MIRRWCVALLLATALAAVGFVMRDSALSGRSSHHELRREWHAALTASPRDAHVDLIIPPRRVVSEGSAKPLLQTFAIPSAAGAVALAGGVRRRRVALAPSARSPLPVLSGPRAPPVLRFAGI